MKKTFLPFFVLLVLSLCGSCITEEDAPEGQGTRIAVGDRLPFFSVKMSDGTIMTTDSLWGHRSVVVFFHTSCPDCQKVLPCIDSLYRIYNGVPDAAYWNI